MTESSQTLTQTDDKEGVLDAVRQFFDGASDVLPRETGSGRPLLMVIAAMCYLAALTMAGVLTINTSVGDWTNQLSQTLTVQLPSIPGDVDSVKAANEQLRAVTQVLEKQKGILRVRPIEREESATMLEPWLGVGNVDDDLPIPQLIEVYLEDRAKADLDTIAQKLEETVPGTRLDDHTRWNSQILVFADFLQGIAYLILGLIAATTIAIVMFATRAGLDAREEVVEILHLIGARDDFIAREFQNHNLWLGLKASLVGLVAALATLILISTVTGASNGASTHYLLPPIEVSVGSVASLILVPVVICLVISVTTRLTVLQVLKKTL